MMPRKAYLKAKFAGGICRACELSHIKIGQAIMRYGVGWAAWRCVRKLEQAAKGVESGTQGSIEQAGVFGLPRRK